MTPQQKILVAENWKHVVPIADTAASMFYDRLFELDPQVGELFGNTDMANQRNKLVQALDMAISALDEPEAILPALRELGRRHRTYGVRDAHYDTVGAALLWTLRKGLGAHWNDEAEAAWSAAYQLVAEPMRQAAA
jgi:hemoglobin-like flavoprotein